MEDDYFFYHNFTITACNGFIFIKIMPRLYQQSYAREHYAIQIVLFKVTYIDGLFLEFVFFLPHFVSA